MRWIYSENSKGWGSPDDSNVFVSDEEIAGEEPTNGLAPHLVAASIYLRQREQLQYLLDNQ